MGAPRQCLLADKERAQLVNRSGNLWNISEGNAFRRRVEAACTTRPVRLGAPDAVAWYSPGLPSAALSNRAASTHALPRAAAEREGDI